MSFIHDKGQASRFIYQRWPVLLFLFFSAVAFSPSLSGQETKYFQVSVTCGYERWQDTSFIVATDDPDLIQQAYEQLAKPLVERQLVAGLLDYGSGGFNRNDDLWFDWHIKHNTWEFVDVGYEACDGCPFSDLQQDTAYWIGDIGEYCPWSSRLVREVQGPVTPVDPPIAEPVLELFPNPARTHVWVSRIDKLPLQVAIFNLTGKAVAPERTIASGEAIDVSNLPPGMYLMSVRQGAWQSVKRLIVKR